VSPCRWGKKGKKTQKSNSLRVQKLDEINEKYVRRRIFGRAGEERGKEKVVNCGVLRLEGEEKKSVARRNVEGGKEGGG